MLEHLKNYWRPLAAITYLIICMVDFVVMPVLVQQERPTNQEFFEMAMKDSKAVSSIVQISKWTPMTTEGGGILHIAFGGILTGAAVTRGLEKVEKEKSKGFQNGRPDRMITE